MKKFLTLIIMLVFLLLVGCTTVKNVTVVFDTDGGSSVGAVVVKKGDKVAEPEDPTKENYEFNGWYLNEVLFDFETPINESITLVAKWNEVDDTLTYTVIFKDYNGTVLKEEKVEEGKGATAPANPTREGYKFVGWDKTFTNIKSDLTVTAVYEEIKNYSVVFKDYDGKVLSEQTVEEGKGATAPANPTREGYTFTGWDYDYSVITEDVVITAKYVQDGKTTFTVVFKDHDGKVLKQETVEEGKGATAPANPTREGFKFSGWDVSFDNVTSNLEVTAQYEELKYFTVTFKDHDGTILKQYKVLEGEAAEAPADPTREGYTFVGWNKKFDKITGNLTVMAEYEEVAKFTVVFKDYNGTVLKEEIVEIGKSATAPADPTREGYEFKGWNKSFSNVTSNLEVIALYESKTNNEYAISYELNGGAWGYVSKEDYVYNFLKDFYSFVKPSETLVEFIYGTSSTEFLGSWRNYIGGSESTNNKLIYNNDLTANNDDYFFNSTEYKEKWSSLGYFVRDKICASNKRFGYADVQYLYGALDFYRYIISDPSIYIDIYGKDFYNYPTVNEPTLFSYKPSNEAIKLPTPISDLFEGWYINSDFSGEPITEIKALTIGDIILYAKWDNTVTYEIIFDSNGGTAVESITVQYDQEVTLPTNLTKTDYEFKGWSLNGSTVANPFKFTYRSSIVLKAVWKSTNVSLEGLYYDGTPVTYRGTSTVVQIPTEYIQPDEQLRAAWVSSYAGNFTPSANESTMKNELQAILDLFVKYNLNCMIFHIRTTNNAFYKTDLAPIQSNYGTYESFDDWDYLEWLINECHKRGIEFHAWLNPYRIKPYGYDASATPQTVADTYKDYPKNPASDPENILLTYRSDGTKGAILNPYEEVVQDYIVDVCIEVMEKYNVDAIHFDDYFYAQMSSGITVLTEPDQDDYEEYINANPNCGYSKSNATDKKQWRRDNIDSFIYKLSTAMTEFNIKNGRGVQLGISPTGIYRNGNGKVTYDENGTAITNGSNTAGQEHYSSYLFCDTKKWIDEEWIDYIMPQTYWAFTHSVAGYADVIDWWDKVVANKDVNLYSGLGLYMSIDGGNYSWGRQPYEISNQIRYTTKLKNVKGISFYSFASLRTVHNSQSQIAHPGLQKVLNEYFTEKVQTPKTMASKYIK